MNQEKIGQCIKEARIKKGLTQTELGERLGVSYKAVSKWERGINLPDASLFKPLCEELELTLDGLFNGEVVTSNKKKYKWYLLLILIPLLLILGVVILKNKDIDIYNIAATLNNLESPKQVLTYQDSNVYYYGIKKVELVDYQDKKYDILKIKKVNFTKIKAFLDKEYSNNKIKRYIYLDGGSTVYQTENYKIVYCNTLNGNHDIYFINPNLVNGIDGLCGHEKDDTCYFTRTYYVLNMYEDSDEEFIQVTLREFQGEIATVKIGKSYDIKPGSNYEFKFMLDIKITDTIQDIFLNATLISVTETTKTGLEQVNESICVNE